LIRRLPFSAIKRLIILVIGFTFILVGLAMTVLPGPATLVIPLGLAILATEFVWARRILQKLKDEVAGVVKLKRGNPEKHN
jgi:hypothetical protein